jgi:hypothetical protein
MAVKWRPVTTVRHPGCTGSSHKRGEGGGSQPRGGRGYEAGIISLRSAGRAANQLRSIGRSGLSAAGV